MSMKPLDIQAFNEWRTNMHQSTWGWERVQAHATMIGEASARIMMYKTDKPGGGNALMLDNARTEAGKILLQTLALCQAVGLDPQAIVHERTVNNSIRWTGKFPIPAETTAELITRPELMRSEAFVTAFKMYYQFGSACTDKDARDITLNMMLNAAGVRELTNADIERLEVTHGVNRPTMFRVMPEGGHYEGSKASMKHMRVSTKYDVRLAAADSVAAKTGTDYIIHNSPDHFVYVGHITNQKLRLTAHYHQGREMNLLSMGFDCAELPNAANIGHVTFRVPVSDMKDNYVSRVRAEVLQEIEQKLQLYYAQSAGMFVPQDTSNWVIDLPDAFTENVRKKIEEIPTVLPLDLRRDGADKTFSVGHSKAADISAQYYIEVAKGRGLRDPADYKLDTIHLEEIENTKPHPYPAGSKTVDPYFGMHPNAAEKLILRNFTDTFTCNPTLTLPTLPDAEDSVLRDAEFCHQLGVKLEGRPLPLVIKYADLHGLPYFSIYPQQWRGCGAEDGNFWFPEDVRELEVGDIHMRLISATMVDFLASNAGVKSLIRMADTIANVKGKFNSTLPRVDYNGIKDHVGGEERVELPDRLPTDYLVTNGTPADPVRKFEEVVTNILKEKGVGYRLTLGDISGVMLPEGWNGDSLTFGTVFYYPPIYENELVGDALEAFIKPIRDYLRNLE